MPYENAATSGERAARASELPGEQMLEFAESLILAMQTATLEATALAGFDLHAARGHRATMRTLDKRMKQLSLLMCASQCEMISIAVANVMASSDGNTARALRTLRMYGVHTLGTPAVPDVGRKSAAGGYPPCPT